MAQRRMFSKTITSSSKFLKMPATSRLLYYDLGMNADDDGYVEWFTVIRMTGAAEQDLKVLQANEFVHIFDDLVLMIREWKENNYIRTDRYIPSKYLARYRLDTIGIPNDNQMDTQVRIGKDNIIVEPKVSTDIISNKNMNKIYAYDENRFSDDQETTIDYNTGDISRGKPKEKVSDEIRNQAKLFFIAYQDLFAKLILTGFRPELATRSPKLLKPTYSAINRYGFKRLMDMLVIYMNEDNKYYKSQGWNIYTFLSNRVLLELDIKAQAQNGTN